MFDLRLQLHHSVIHRMGQATSTAGRSYKAAEAAGKAAVSVNVATTTGSAVAADAQRAAAQQSRRVPLSLEEEEQQEARDEAFGSLLDQIGGAIHGTAINISPTERLAPHPSNSAGRLPPQALKELFELQQQAQGGPVDASHFVSKYSTDPKLIERVLQTVCLPDVVEAKGSAGVEAFAEYPVWFSRRR